MLTTAGYPRTPDEGPSGKRAKHLRPLPLVVLGTLLLAVATAAIAELTFPEYRGVRGILFGLSMGIMTGLFLLLPIALLEMFRPTLVRWLQPFAFRIQLCSSLAMAFGMGYWLASWRHAEFDALGFAAFCLVGIGAWTKAGLSVVFRSCT